MLKVTAFYPVTTEPKLVHCQPRSATISPVRWKQGPVAPLKNYQLAKFFMQ